MPLVLSGTDGVSGVDGTASNPSYEGTDSNTGIFYPAADTIAFAEGGVESLRLNSSGQIAVNAAGSASTPTITKADDLNTGIFFPAADTVAIGTGGTERLRVDSAGNAGLGVTPSASNKTKIFEFSFAGNQLWANDVNEMYLSSNAYFNSGFKYGGTGNATQYMQYAGQHIWKTAPSGTAGNAITFTQAMTLDASGNLLVGKTASSLSTVGGEMLANGRIYSTLSTNNGTDTFSLYSTGAGAYRFYVLDTGRIYATNTTITAISDVRLKENIVTLDVGLAEIMALQPRKFDWKEGKGKDIKGDRGWIAQEFEQVFPDMVSTWLGESPEGEEPYKSVGADLIPVLVKAIQEQQAMIDEMKTEIAALKAQP